MGETQSTWGALRPSVVGARRRPPRRRYISRREPRRLLLRHRPRPRVLSRSILLRGAFPFLAPGNSYYFGGSSTLASEASLPPCSPDAVLVSTRLHMWTGSIVIAAGWWWMIHKVRQDYSLRLNSSHSRTLMIKRGISNLNRTGWGKARLADFSQDTTPRGSGTPC